MNRVYLDYASLTPIDGGVLRQMKKYSKKDYTNPMALYKSAVLAKNATNDAKTRIAEILHVHSDEIIFTSGGTESNALVLQNKINKHIIISAIEHSSIINTVEATRIPVDKNGVIDLEILKKSITPETTLVSVMLVNNEIGTIEPLHEIAKIVRDARKKFGTNYPLLHTDACQAGIHLPLNIERLGVDLMTLDGSKIYGPRGVGMLYVKRGVMNITRLGTENLPGIMGFAYALELAEKNREKDTKRIAMHRALFLEKLKIINPGITVNGDLNNSSPHILNIYIPNIDNEFFILQLDAKGVEGSLKSACLRDEKESYVLKAIGASSPHSIRLSFGRNTYRWELWKALRAIKDILNNDTDEEDNKRVED